MPCRARQTSKRRTDKSDTPVSESVERGADWSGHAGGGTGPPEKMIREMAETGGTGRSFARVVIVIVIITDGQPHPKR